jgi:hypothetical protein
MTVAASTDWGNGASNDRFTQHVSLVGAELAAYDAEIDAQGKDGLVAQEWKITENAISCVGELADVLSKTGRAMVCVVHKGRAPTQCPVCALAYVRNSRGLRVLGRVYASGR